MMVEWEISSRTRYNVANYIARDGGNGLTGDCGMYILQPAPSNGNEDDTSLYGTRANPTLGPYYEANGDTCGDLSQNYILYQKIENVTITCRDQDKDGVVDFTACNSWENNAPQAACSGVDTAPCGTTSKCQCYAAVNIVGISMTGSLLLAE